MNCKSIFILGILCALIKLSASSTSTESSTSTSSSFADADLEDSTSSSSLTENGNANFGTFTEIVELLQAFQNVLNSFHSLVEATKSAIQQITSLPCDVLPGAASNLSRILRNAISSIHFTHIIPGLRPTSPEKTKDRTPTPESEKVKSNIEKPGNEIDSESRKNNFRNGKMYSSAQLQSDCFPTIVPVPDPFFAPPIMAPNMGWILQPPPPPIPVPAPDTPNFYSYNGFSAPSYHLPWSVQHQNELRKQVLQIPQIYKEIVTKYDNMTESAIDHVQKVQDTATNFLRKTEEFGDLFRRMFRETQNGKKNLQVNSKP